MKVAAQQHYKIKCMSVEETLVSTNFNLILHVMKKFDLPPILKYNIKYIRTETP